MIEGGRRRTNGQFDAKVIKDIDIPRFFLTVLAWNVAVSLFFKSTLYCILPPSSNLLTLSGPPIPILLPWTDESVILMGRMSIIFALKTTYSVHQEAEAEEEVECIR